MNSPKNILIATLLATSAMGWNAIASPLRRETGKGVIQRGDEVLFRVEFEKLRVAQDAETYLFRTLNRDRSLAIEERAESKGGSLFKYSMKNRQTGLQAQVKIKDGVATYTRTLNGKTDTRTETLPKNLPMISGPQISQFLAEQNQRLLEKGVVKFLLPVLDRAESIEFEIIRRDEVVHEMRPSNAIYQMFVRKILIEIDPQTRQVRQVYGRVLPMLKNAGKWQAVEAMLVYAKKS